MRLHPVIRNGRRAGGTALVLLVALASTQACDSPTTPTPPTPIPIVTPPPGTQMRISGTVTDDVGTPVPGARVSWMSFTTLTDQAGKYGLTTWVETWSAVRVQSEGFEDSYQYATRGAETIEEDNNVDVQLRRVVRITAGESTVVGVGPRDSYYGFDLEYQARAVRIVTPQDGILEVEATTDAGAALGMAVGIIPDYPCCSTRISRLVTAGQEMVVHLILGWQTGEERQVTVSSRFTPR